MNTIWKRLLEETGPKERELEGWLLGLCSRTMESEYYVMLMGQSRFFMTPDGIKNWSIIHTTSSQSMVWTEP